MITTNAIGRLTEAPELRTTGNDTPVANFTIASDNRPRPGRDDTSSFLRVTLWGSQAENAATHLVKGQLVAVTGRLEQTSWTTDDGETRTSWELTGNEIEYLTKPRPAANGDEQPF